MATAIPAAPSQVLPNHNDLPDKDGTFANSSQEHPQRRMLSSALEPVLQRLHADGQYFLGENVGIYFQWTSPPLLGVKAPDWFYVPNVPPLWKGEVRRSYVLWQEPAVPMVLLEFVASDGYEEHDQTPETGRFWVYEQKIRARYYGIYEVHPGRVELYQLVEGRYQPVPSNERGHFAIPPLGVELGIWQGKYLQYDLPWLRWWDAQGNLLLNAEERAEHYKHRAESLKQQRERAEHLHCMENKLRELGVDPDTL